MISKDLRTDVVSYYILTYSLCINGESRKEMRLLDEMSRKGLKPSHVTYNSLMDGHSKEGSLRAALDVRTWKKGEASKCCHSHIDC